MRKECLPCLLQFRVSKYMNVTLKPRISDAGMWTRIVTSFSLMKRNYLCRPMAFCLIDLSFPHKIAPCPLRSLLMMVIEKGGMSGCPKSLWLNPQRVISHSHYLSTWVGRHSDPHGCIEMKTDLGLYRSFAQPQLGGDVTVTSHHLLSEYIGPNK